MNAARAAQRASPGRVLPVMVVGISGATWTVIDPMMADGALPVLRRLMREGSWGVLDSVRTVNDKHYRPQTAWLSLLTGKLPERHGVTRYFHTCANLKSRCAWDFFSEMGLSVGLYAGPVLWPPPRVNGFVIPAPYGRDNSTWPEDLSFIMRFYRDHEESKLRINYLATMLKSLKFVPMLVGRGQDRRIPINLLRSAIDLSRERNPEVKALILRTAKLYFSTAMFLSLYKKYAPHFSLFTTFELDYVSHRYWRYHEPARFPGSPGDPAPALRNAVKDVYTRVDECIGLLLKRVPAGCIIAVVSEHGMAAEERSAEIGRWQYLINVSKLRSLAGIGDDIVAIPIARWIAFRRSDGGPLDGTIEARLRDIRVSETGLPVFTTHSEAADEVVIKLNIHRGDYPDLDDIGVLHVKIPGMEVMPIGSILDRAGPRRSAMHTKEGIVILKGPGIRADSRIEGAVITDIMPTLLSASGIEAPGDLDGRSLDVFS